MPAARRLLRPSGSRHANRYFLVAGVLAALLTIGFGAWMALRPDGDVTADALRRFGEAAAALIAAVACTVAATQHSGRSRFAWVLLGTGALFWAVGDGVAAYYEFIGDQLRYPPITDIGPLAFVPRAVARIAVFPGRHRGATRIAFLLDGAILAGALVLISWATVLGSVYHAETGVGASAVTGLAYPISDIVMAVMALLLVGRTSGHGRLPLLLVMTGIFANLLADSASVYLTTVTGEAPPQIMGTGWAAGFLLMVVVALVIVRQFIVILDNQTLNQKLASQTLALQDSEDHFRSLVQNSGDVVLLADAGGVVRFVSTSIDRFFAYSSTELVGQPFSDLLHPSDQPAFATGLKKALTASALPVVVHCRFRHKLGSWPHCEVTITNLLHRSSSQALVLNIRDVTDRKDMEERLAYLGAHDPVTNLPNRIAFRKLVDEALERSAPGRAIAVLALDIDDFKLVNDALGHRAGHDLLGMVGGRVGKMVSAGDGVARMGADEFAILMKTVLNDDQPSHLAERIFQHFKAPFKVEER